MAIETDDGTARVRDWITTNYGGTVTGIRRQPRWRPVWFADVERDGVAHELCVRGDRTDMTAGLPARARDAAPAHDARPRHPGAEGLRLDRRPRSPTSWTASPARNDFANDRRRAPLGRSTTTCRSSPACTRSTSSPFVEAGILRAPTPEESGTLGMARYERRVPHDQAGAPTRSSSSASAWLKRNPPDSQGARDGDRLGLGPVPPRRRPASSPSSTSRSATSAIR